MSTLFQYLTITFVLLLSIAVFLSYCKRRQSRTSHGLTGMCHKSGGTMSGCCSSLLQKDHRKSNGVSCTKKTS